MEIRTEELNIETRQIFFEPWIGENYYTGINGKKILILGESHHCPDRCLDCGTTETSHNCNALTKDVILTYLAYKNGEKPFENCMNTFTKFANIFKGKQLSSQEHINFWESVAFYNYVQKAIYKARISPSSDEFKNSLSAFHYLIENIKPDLIIMWGSRLWDNLQKNIFFSTELNDKNEKVAYYKNDNVKIPLKIIYHPSSSKLDSSHTTEISEFIKSA